MVLDKDFYLSAFHSESAALAEAARLGSEAPLPSCPGWSVVRLLGHLGAIYISVGKNIRVGHGEDVVNELEDLDLPHEFEEWFRQEYALEALPPTVVEWYQECARELEEVFRASSPNERTWTWWTPDQTVGFWMRRMAHETAVHRWDAQLAHGREEPISRELAEDGIDEALAIYQPRWCRPESQVPGKGETYQFHQTDGPGEWVVRFEGDGMEVRREHGRSDVAIRGSASDLLLFLWHRIPASQLEIEGDRSLVERYFEFVPPD